MSICVIRVERLSKLYRIGRPKQQATGLREVVTDLVASPFRRWAQLGGPPGRGEEFWALRDVSFEVNRGDILGVVGHNGAGKSTLLKIMSRVTHPTIGRVALRGRVGSLLEVGTGFHPDLTGRENIYLSGTILGMRKREIDGKFNGIVEFAGVEKFIDTPLKHYSSGMSVRLGFAVAAHLDPDILVVDEVLAVGDLEFRNRCLGRIHGLQNEGRTVLFVSHDMTSIRQLCTRALMLHGGRVLEDGSPEKITRRYEEMFRKGGVNASAVAERTIPPDEYHLRCVELQDAAGERTSAFQVGDVMQIHLWASGRAPENSFTVEFKLRNSRGAVISFGAANPVRNTYFGADDQHFICQLGPLPLTEGHYSFDFAVRVWNKHRWDSWDDAIGFDITNCDLFGTGHSVSSTHDGDFVIPQQWSSE